MYSNIGLNCHDTIPLKGHKHVIFYLYEAACIHNFGDLKGVDWQPTPVLGFEITQAKRVLFGPKTGDSCRSIPFKLPKLYIYRPDSKLLRAETFKLQPLLVI